MTEAESYQRAMVVVAHADDAEYSCSGTMAKWCRQGAAGIYVVCTDGSKGSSDPNISSKQLIEIRRQEQRAACEVLGVKEVVFLGYEDSMLQPSLELRRDIAREIRRYKPDVVLCPSPVRDLNDHIYIGHPDHLAAGEAAMSAVFPAARDRLTFPELLADGFEPHKVRDLMVMDHQHTDKWIDVTETIDLSIDALRKHVSQIGDLGEEHLEMVRDWKRQAGEPHGVGYAETFRCFHLG